MNYKIKKRLFWFISFNLLILAFAIFYDLLFKNRLIGDCVFLKTLGFYCPGCGGSRSLNALLSLDLLSSFKYYPPILITSVILFYCDLKVLISIIKKDDKIKGINRNLFLIIPAAIIAHFILKNLLLFFGIDLLGNIFN